MYNHYVFFAFFHHFFKRFPCLFSPFEDLPFISVIKCLKKKNVAIRRNSHEMQFALLPLLAASAPVPYLGANTSSDFCDALPAPRVHSYHIHVTFNGADRVSMAFALDMRAAFIKEFNLSSAPCPFAHSQPSRTFPTMCPFPFEFDLNSFPVFGGGPFEAPNFSFLVPNHQPAALPAALDWWRSRRITPGLSHVACRMPHDVRITCRMSRGGGRRTTPPWCELCAAHHTSHVARRVWHIRRAATSSHILCCTLRVACRLLHLVGTSRLMMIVACRTSRVRMFACSQAATSP